MKCLRCNSEMKQYKCATNISLYGIKYKPNAYYAPAQESHNPKSAFVCDNCGYIEFSTKDNLESNI